MAQHARKQEVLPDHEYADRHTLLRAKRANPRRRIRSAEDVRPSGEVAAERIREYGWDIGAEAREENPGGWMAATSRALGISESTGWWILSGNASSVSTRTVDTIARTNGIPVGVFYDPEQ